MSHGNPAPARGPAAPEKPPSTGAGGSSLRPALLGFGAHAIARGSLTPLLGGLLVAILAGLTGAGPKTPRLLDLPASIGSRIAASAGRRGDIPPFTPNVVDPQHYLSSEDQAEIHAFIQQVRTEADIAGAVYITDRLHGGTIEDLANQTFDAWKLGEAGKDNGLLLVLVMKDRKMRFQTGYGLEGDLPDVVCLEALDSFLRPRLREGSIRQGVIDAISFLARRRNPSFAAGGRAATEESPSRFEERGPAASGRTIFDSRSGLGAFLAWVLAWALRMGRDGARRARSVDGPGPGRGGLLAGGLVLRILLSGVVIFIVSGFVFANRSARLALLRGVSALSIYGLTGFAVARPLRLYLEAGSRMVSRLLADYPEPKWSDGKKKQPALAFALRRALRAFQKESEQSSPQIAGGMASFALFTFDLAGGTSGTWSLLWFQLPTAIFVISMLLAARDLRNFETAEAFRAYLERRRRRARPRSSSTRAYSISHRSRSSSTVSRSWSSSESSRSSSSEGGESGGGGASSDW